MLEWFDKFRWNICRRMQDGVGTAKTMGLFFWIGLCTVMPAALYLYTTIKNEQEKIQINGSNSGIFVMPYSVVKWPAPLIWIYVPFNRLVISSD